MWSQVPDWSTEMKYELGPKPLSCEAETSISFQAGEWEFEMFYGLKLWYGLKRGRVRFPEAVKSVITNRANKEFLRGAGATLLLVGLALVYIWGDWLMFIEGFNPNDIWNTGVANWLTLIGISCLLMSWFDDQSENWEAFRRTCALTGFHSETLGECVDPYSQVEWVHNALRQYGLRVKALEVKHSKQNWHSELINARNDFNTRFLNAKMSGFIPEGTKRHRYYK